MHGSSVCGLRAEGKGVREERQSERERKETSAEREKRREEKNWYASRPFVPPSSCTHTRTQESTKETEMTTSTSFDQQDYHPDPPPKTSSSTTYKAVKGECTNLMRDNAAHDLENTVIDDFTVFSPSMKIRVPFKHMVLSRRVEMLWKTSYYLDHPSIPNGTSSMLSLAELVRVMELSKDLVDKSNFYIFLCIEITTSN